MKYDLHIARSKKNGETVSLEVNLQDGMANHPMPLLTARKEGNGVGGDLEEDECLCEMITSSYEEVIEIYKQEVEKMNNPVIHRNDLEPWALEAVRPRVMYLVYSHEMGTEFQVSQDAVLVEEIEAYEPALTDGEINEFRVLRRYWRDLRWRGQKLMLVSMVKEHNVFTDCDEWWEEGKCIERVAR